MIKKLILAGQLVRNMGLRYTLFRAQYELKKRFLTPKSYVLTKRFNELKTGELKTFKSRLVGLFVRRGTNITPKKPSNIIQSHFHNIQNRQVNFFRHEWRSLDQSHPWHRNPDSAYLYPAELHWSKIADYSTAQGDIKYVWERARFTHLLDIIRHDYHFEQDHAKEVFDEIADWILANPSEMGPHYRCSQEISLRLMHWLMAITYYKDSTFFTEAFWLRFERSVYEQLTHVYDNINFSRIAVRNNHALTESLMLYIGASLFPHFPKAAAMKRDGKKYFEEEIAYQIYPDGSYLQFSNNYHRVVTQLLSIAISFAECQGDRWSDTLYARAAASLKFLQVQCDSTTGHLPNYGNNDGALFFPLSDASYRDYRPSLQALHIALYKQEFYPVECSEEAAWLCNRNGAPFLSKDASRLNGLHQFKTSQGGYLSYRDEESYSFLKCCSYKDRPAQADNLHLDLWYSGENIIRDNGSYKYNADPASLRYFMGTASHNTVQLGTFDQMLKGGRFIWYYWNKQAKLACAEDETSIVMNASVEVYAHLKKGIRHTRIVRKMKGRVEWLVEDSFNERAGQALHQRWHIAPDFLTRFEITAVDGNGIALTYTVEDCFYSSHYGEKEPSKCIIFTSETNSIATRIALKQ